MTAFIIFVAIIASVAFIHYIITKKRDSLLFSLVLLILLVAIFLSLRNTSIEVKALGISLSTKLNQIESQQKELTRIVTNLTKMIEIVEQKPAVWGSKDGKKPPVSEDLKKLERELHPYIQR